MTYAEGIDGHVRPADTGAAARATRRSLEAFHGKKDPAAVEIAWPYLSNDDRYLRYAALVAIEHQDSASWKQKALSIGLRRRRSGFDRSGPRQRQHLFHRATGAGGDGEAKRWRG